jgi:hypothetical protein
MAEPRSRCVSRSSRRLRRTSAPHGILALEDAKGKDTALKEACRVGLKIADQDVQGAKDPVFIEARENPAYAHGVATYNRLNEEKAREGDVRAAAVAFRDVWEAAVKDAETRNNVAYKEACQRWLVTAKREVDAVTH